MAKQKLFLSILKAIKNGKLPEPFSSNDVKIACLGFAEKTYPVFLPKHRRGNPGNNSVLFERISKGRYKVIRANLKEIDPSQIIKKSSLRYYNKRRYLIWSQLVYLNCYIFLLYKLLNFPVDLFVEPIKQNIFVFVKQSLFGSSLLIITNLAADPRKDVLTIRRFRDEIVTKYIKDKYLQSLWDSLRNNNFKKITRDIGERAIFIRNKYLAHLDINSNLKPKISENISISFPEVKIFCEQLNKLFSILCFGEGFSFLPIDYEPMVIHPEGVDKRSDIEYILDLIAKDSDILNMPESNWQGWKIYKQNLTKEGLDIINQYRKKFGMCEV